MTRLAAVCLVALAAQPAPAQEKAPAPLAGTWRAELSDGRAMVLAFRGDAVSMAADAAGAVTPLWAGTARFPADGHVDWVGLTAGGRPVPDNKCLYRVAGDTLLVIGGGPADRPTRFLTGPGPGPTTLVFTRVR